MNAIKLFCMPHAGASASVYYKWNDIIQESLIQLVPIEYRGHGMRMDETFYRDFDEMSEEVYSFVCNELSNGEKYMIFGHSMGSYVAFELEKKLESRLNRQAEHVIFSGREAPCFWGLERKISHLEESEFLESVISFGGISEEYINDPNILEFLSPIIRNDFRIIESMDTKNNLFKLNVPITVFNGNKDRCMPEHIKLWSEYSKKECKIQCFEGGHFYINNHYKAICEYINSFAQQSLNLIAY